MIKYILYITLISISSLSVGQVLKENKVDDFTNNTIKRTSWESINMTMQFAAFFRISKINDNTFFDLKMLKGKSVFSIDEGQELMLTMSNQDIVKLPNLEYTVTCLGCGAKGLVGSKCQGINVSYPLTNEQIEVLKTYTGKKLRIYTNDGYVENDMKIQNYKKIQTALVLIE